MPGGCRPPAPLLTRVNRWLNRGGGGSTAASPACSPAGAAGTRGQRATARSTRGTAAGNESLKSQLIGDCSLHTAARPVGSRAHTAAGCATTTSDSGDENEDRANNDVKDDDLLDRGRLSDGRPKVLWPHWVRDIAEI